MNAKRIAEVLDGLMETLAAVEHERWAHWQKYMHGKGAVQDDGSLLLPANLVKQWQEQITKPYAELSEKEKESDREQVRKYLPLITRELGE